MYTCIVHYVLSIMYMYYVLCYSTLAAKVVLYNIEYTDVHIHVHVLYY